MTNEITVSEKAIEYGCCGEHGEYTEDFRNAVAWRSCSHDIGNGACAACVEAGSTEWVHPFADGTGLDDTCMHITAADALECYLGK